MNTQMARVVQLRNIKRALKLEPSDAVNYVVSGRVENFRRYRSFNFVDLIDGSSKEHIQVIIKNDLLKKPELGSYLTCRGQIAASRGSKQAIEFKADQIDYLGKCDPEKYPLAQESNLIDSWLRNNIHLRPRASHFASMLRVRSELELSMHMILKQMDFFKVHSPTLTANDSEASSDLFMVQRSRQLSKINQSSLDDEAVQEDSDSDEVRDRAEDDKDDSQAAASMRAAEARKRILKGGYFGDKDVFMITSAQLHLECLAASLSRVYSLGPTFRAESSLSRRHLCEFTMLEAEESNVRQLGPLMDRVESIVKFCAQYLGEVSEHKSDFSSLLERNSNEPIYKKLISARYIRMTYDEAIAILQKLNPSTSRDAASDSRQAGNNVCYGCDINRWHERMLLDYCDNVPIFITNYPKSLKPFYMKSCGGAQHLADKVENFDLIAPIGGEICGGSLREDNLDTLRENLKLHDEHQQQLGNHQTNDSSRLEAGEQASDPFAWYLELRQFGTFPHGGFGIGFERLIQSMLGVKNIRDTIAFPRWRGQCSM